MVLSYPLIIESVTVSCVVPLPFVTSNLILLKSNSSPYFTSLCGVPFIVIDFTESTTLTSYVVVFVIPFSV